jgi:cell division septal protein FtsQ
MLERLAFFRVRQVELVGVRNLTPDAVIAALRLGPGASVFSDTRLLADRVRGLAGVADARVLRRLPAMLTVEVREVEPAALAPGPRGSRGLVVVDATGRPLPFDPARSGLDLPIVARADSGVVGVLALVQSVDPALFQTITGARTVGRNGVSLEIGSRRVVVVGRNAGPEVIRAVTLVAQDLAAKGQPYAELDARFAGQVVVRRKPTASKGGEGGA